MSIDCAIYFRIHEICGRRKMGTFGVLTLYFSNCGLMDETSKIDENVNMKAVLVITIV